MDGRRGGMTVTTDDLNTSGYSGKPAPGLGSSTTQSKIMMS